MPVDTPDQWKIIGDRLFVARQYSDAIVWYMKVIESDANNSAAWHCMGTSYENLGKYSEAVRCFREERRILDQQFRKKYKQGSRKKVLQYRAVSPVRVIMTGLVIAFFSGFILMVLSYELLGNIDFTVAVIGGLFSAGIYLIRIYLKRQ